MTNSVVILNGPNLNLLGSREPDIYGTTTLADIMGRTREIGEQGGLIVHDYQSNIEAELISHIHHARTAHGAIIINAGAFTHSSWAIADALAAYEGYVVEVHLSNPMRREPWRHTSVVTPHADALICGLGADGYYHAISAVIERLMNA